MPPRRDVFSPQFLQSMTPESGGWWTNRPILQAFRVGSVEFTRVIDEKCALNIVLRIVEPCVSPDSY